MGNGGGAGVWLGKHAVIDLLLKYLREAAIEVVIANGIRGKEQSSQLRVHSDHGRWLLRRQPTV